MKTPTIAAIETAIARAEAMHGVYDCEAVPGLTGRFYVQHKSQPKRCHIVDARPGKQHCSCPQFAKAAVCKHGAFAHESERIAQGEEEAAERYACR